MSEKRKNTLKSQALVIQQVATWNGKLTIGPNYGEEKMKEVDLRTFNYHSNDPWDSYGVQVAQRKKYLS